MPAPDSRSCYPSWATNPVDEPMNLAHRKFAELLPWYVTGKLPEHERAEIEQHLKECLPCRAALREEQRIHGLIQTEDDIPLSAEHGMSNLMRRIDGRNAKASSWRSPPRFAYAAAVVAVAIAGTWLLTRPFLPGAGETDAPFTTLTDSEISGGNRIDIVFIDSLAESEIRQILDAADARPVAGPSELGRYTVAVEAASDDELSRIIERLAADPRVRFVGPNYIPSSTTDPDDR